VRRLGTDYFCRRTALDIVARCEEMKLPILGIDGYFLTETTTHQPIEWILDLSNSPLDYEAARRFIAAGTALPLFYEFVLGAPTKATRRRWDRSSPCETHCLAAMKRDGFRDRSTSPTHPRYAGLHVR
jgi:hypothetical protein